jgi:hypothetical protein
MNITAQDIVSAIAHNSWTTDEMNNFIQAIKYNRAQQTRQTCRKLHPGDIVKFRTRNGTTVQGIVERIKIKNVVVHTPSNGRYNVPASLLEIC